MLVFLMTDKTYSFKDIIFDNITNENITFNIKPEVNGLKYNTDKNGFEKLKNCIIGNVIEYMISNTMSDKTLTIDNINYNITETQPPFDLTYVSDTGKYINIEIKSAKQFGHFTLCNIDNCKQKTADYFIFVLYNDNDNTEDISIKNIYIKKGPYNGKTRTLSKQFIQQDSIKLYE